MTEHEKVQIIYLTGKGLTKAAIAAELKRNESTIRTFLKSYQLTDMLFPPRGRTERKIEQDMVDKIIHDVYSNRRLTLRGQSKEYADASKDLLCHLRHEQGYRFCKSVPTCPLNNQHMHVRMRFCNEIAYENKLRDLPVIFTDESMVQQNLNLGGVWRRWGSALKMRTLQKPLILSVSWCGVGLDPSGIEQNS